MTSVFLLWHTNQDTEDSKLLGVFSSEENAKNAMQQYGELPGFKDYPEGFLIDRYKLDERLWLEGFISG